MLASCVGALLARPTPGDVKLELAPERLRRSFTAAANATNGWVNPTVSNQTGPQSASVAKVVDLHFETDNPSSYIDLPPAARAAINRAVNPPAEGSAPSQARPNEEQPAEMDENGRADDEKDGDNEDEEHEGETGDVCTSRWEHATHGLVQPSPPESGAECLEGREPTVLFVHVGKTCGGSVNAALETNAAAIEARYPGHPAYAMVHAHAVRRKVLNGCGKHVIVTLRDPVDRLVSAFNTMACKYDASVADKDLCMRKKHADFMLQHPHQKTTKDLLGCFPNVTAYANSIDDDSECGKIARQSLGPQPHGRGANGHISLGSCFYLGGLLETLQKKSVYIVDTESCDADIQGIPHWLGLNQSFAYDKSVVTHVGDFPHHTDTISSAGRAKLRRHLEHEYRFQEQIRALGIRD